MIYIGYRTRLHTYYLYLGSRSYIRVYIWRELNCSLYLNQNVRIAFDPIIPYNLYKYEFYWIIAGVLTYI